MKKDGNYHLVPMNKIGAESRANRLFVRDKSNIEERILEELEYKIFKAYKQFLSSIDSSDRYFVMGESVISEVFVDEGTTLFKSEAYVYEVKDIKANRKTPAHHYYASSDFSLDWTMNDDSDSRNDREAEAANALPQFREIGTHQEPISHYDIARSRPRIDNDRYYGYGTTRHTADIVATNNPPVIIDPSVTS